MIYIQLCISLVLVTMMCTKKFRLLLNVLSKGQTGWVVYRCLRDTLIMGGILIGFVMLCISIVINAYLLARDTPFYISFYGEDQKLRVCDRNILNMGNCVASGIIYSVVLTPALLFSISLLVCRPEGYRKALLIATIITASCFAIIYNFVSIMMLFSTTLSEICVYDYTAGRYSYECFDKTGNYFAIALVVLVLIMVMFMVMMIPMYEGWISCRKRIKEDLDTFNMESIKVDN